MTAVSKEPGSAASGPVLRALSTESTAASRTREPLQVVGGAVRKHLAAGAPRPNPMAVLIDLEIEARECPDLSALKYAIVNSTRKLAPYDQAFLLEIEPVSQLWRISVASSISNVDRHAALPRALEAWINNPQQPLRQSINKLQSLDVTIGEQSIEVLDGESIFPNAVWMPFKTRSGISAALVALRETPWEPAYLNLLIPLAGAYAHAWDALAPEKSGGWRDTLTNISRRRVGFAATAALALAAFIPIPMTALAPAEIVAASPELIVAPIDGVVQDILVQPGAPVEKGTPLVRFADTKLRNEFELAAKAKAVAEAKYFKALQAAVSTQKDMQDLSVTKAELAMADAELAYAREMLSRVELRSSHSGLAIYSAKSDWVGKPVSTGERIMEIADPKKTEIRIDLQVSDAIALKPGGRVTLFLDGEPLDAIEATIERMSYRPIVTQDHQMVFRLAAKLADGGTRRIGIRGTARLSGETVSLGFYLLRRPVALARQKLGL